MRNSSLKIDFLYVKRLDKYHQNKSKISQELSDSDKSIVLFMVLEMSNTGYVIHFHVRKQLKAAKLIFGKEAEMINIFLISTSWSLVNNNRDKMKTNYYINTSVLLGFLPLRKSIYLHMQKYDILTCKNTKSQVLRLPLL